MSKLLLKGQPILSGAKLYVVDAFGEGNFFLVANIIQLWYKLENLISDSVW